MEKVGAEAKNNNREAEASSGEASLAKGLIEHN